MIVITTVKFRILFMYRITLAVLGLMGYICRKRYIEVTKMRCNFIVVQLTCLDLGQKLYQKHQPLILALAFSTAVAEWLLKIFAILTGFITVEILWFKVLGMLLGISFSIINVVIPFQVFLILLQLDKKIEKQFCLLLFRRMFLYYFTHNGYTNLQFLVGFFHKNIFFWQHIF